jgi:hypothetical protein
LIEVVKAEKKRFENSGLIPWSELMRPCLARYFTSIRTAEEKLRRTYIKLINAQLKAKNEGMARDLQADLEKLVFVRLLARWRAYLNGKDQGIASLYSNRTINNINGNATWSYENGVLTYLWPNSKAPGGVWIDTLIVSADGTVYAGTNNAPPGKGPKLTGVYVNDN